MITCDARARLINKIFLKKLYVTKISIARGTTKEVFEDFHQKMIFKRLHQKISIRSVSASRVTNVTNVCGPSILSDDIDLTIDLAHERSIKTKIIRRIKLSLLFVVVCAHQPNLKYALFIRTPFMLS